MYESEADLAWLQRILDDSYARAGQHLADVHTPSVRLTARQLTERMNGMRIFVVATVGDDGRVFTGPVDGFLFKGRVHFGTAPTALKARQLAARSTVSATHVEGEDFVFTVHGHARRLDLSGRDRDFTALTRSHYGTGWDEWDGPPVAFAIDPDRLFAGDMSLRDA